MFVENLNIEVVTDWEEGFQQKKKKSPSVF